MKIPTSKLQTIAPIVGVFGVCVLGWGTMQSVTRDIQKQAKYSQQKKTVYIYKA